MSQSSVINVSGAISGRCLALALGILLLGACATFASQLPPAQAHNYRIVGYVAGWAQPPQISAAKLDVVNFAFAHVSTQGDVILDQPDSAAVLARLRKLKSAHPQLKIVVSIGGWGADHFSDAALSAAARERFATSAIDLIRKQALDGIDIDWEYPGQAGPGIIHREEDRSNFTLLLRALRVHLDALSDARGRRGRDRYLLTIAAADSEFVDHVELDKIHLYLDWINLMSYDFHNSLTPTTGHHAGLSRSDSAIAGGRYAERAVAQYLDAGVPAGKLVLGVAFYGRAFSGTTPANHGLYQRYASYAGDYAWSQLVDNYIDKRGYTRYWDERAQAPYLWNPDDRIFISYDDPESLRAKTAFVKARQLGGIMYWEHSQDPDETLLDVLVSGLR